MDKRLALTLNFMDESPVMQKTLKMKPDELEALPESERNKLRKDVLSAIEKALEKADEVIKRGN